MNLPILEDLKKNLANARIAGQSAARDLADLQSPFDAVVQQLHRDFLAREDVQAAQHRAHESAETVHHAEQTLREALIAHYHATQEKTPLKGLGVSVAESVSARITDHAAALAWAEISAPDLVSHAPVLNEAGVLAYHAHIAPLPFVTVTTTTRVTARIAKEL